MLQIDGFTIRFPARRGYLYISRLNAAAIGSEAGFDVDDIEDLRLAVNETVTWLLADEDCGGHIELVMTASDGEIRIDGKRTSTSTLPDNPLDELIDAILGATMDEHRLTSAPNERVMQLAKSTSNRG